MKTVGNIAIASTLVLGALLIVGGALALAAQVQLPGVKRTDLLKNDLGIAGREVVQARVDVDPGVTSAKHFHPGEEIAYVIEGTLEYHIEGKPPITVKAGEALYIPAGVVHAAKNVGTTNAAELATYIVEKNKPLVTVVK
jgi:quercetin dioxygenase-like cupin family protein